MRRRHRETAGGEVAMMAVITKAMGAFLVLMIMLLPYYTGDTQSQQTVDDTRQRIDEAKNGLDAAVDRLKKGRLNDSEIDDLLKRLVLARDELIDAQNLIAQLKIKVDQAASQINRLEQQNAALLSQVATLQSEASALRAEIEALKREIAKLRAFDTTALQARIRDLESDISKLRLDAAKIVPLQNQIASQTAQIESLEKENDKLDTENEILKAFAAQPKIFLSSNCDQAGLMVDLLENPIGIKNFKSIDQFIPPAMPWSGYPAGFSFDERATKSIKGDAYSSSTTNMILSFEDDKEYQYDFFLRLNLRTGIAPDYNAYYTRVESESLRNVNGAVSSSKSHPSCIATMVINWQDNFEQIGVFKLGPVEPLIHIRRMMFSKDRKISYPPEDRPNIEQQIANETCARFPSFCALATQHAKLRARGQNPWEIENLDDSLFSGLPPKALEILRRGITPPSLDNKPPPQNAPVRDPNDSTPRPGPPPPPQRPTVPGVAPR